MSKYVIDKLVEEGEAQSYVRGELIDFSGDLIQFLREYEALCKKHNISISHEDNHGRFEFNIYDEDLTDWVCYGNDERHAIK